MNQIIACLVVALLPSCCLTFPLAMASTFSCENAYAHEAYRNYKPPVTFTIRVDALTPNGVSVDSGGIINGETLGRIDQLVDEFEACYGKPVRRCGFRVKVVPPLLTVPTEGFFCGQGDNGLCTGLTQYPSDVIVTPNLAALKHELVHAVAHKDHGDRLFRCE